MSRGSGSSEKRPTTAHEFSQLARRGKNSFLRYVAALTLVLAAMLLVGLVLVLATGALVAGDGRPDTYLNGRTLEVVGYPLADFAGLTLGFLGVWLGLFVAVRYVHRRPFLTLITTSERVNWGRLVQGFVVYFLLVAAAFAAGYLLDPRGYELVVEPARLLLFVPLVLVLIPIQATAEELLARGYLIQLFGLATSNVVVLSLISGTLFALPHLANPEAAFGTWIYFADVLVFGFTMALITLKDGGMELAVGAHIANNALLFPLVNYDETLLDTPSIFRLLDPAVGYTDLAFTVAVAVAFYLLAFGVFRRKGPDDPVTARPPSKPPENPEQRGTRYSTHGL